MKQLSVLILTLSYSMAWSLPIDVKRIEKPKALYEISRKNLYAIGLTENPGGLITIVNGNIYVARSENGKIAVDTSMKTIASKLAHLEVTSWLEVPLPKNIQTEQELGVEINAALKSLGFENARGIPFLLKGRFKKIHVSVGDGPATIKQSLAKTKGVVFGLFTKTTGLKTKGDDQPTSQFSYAWNFVAESSVLSGRVDALEILAADHVALFLPR